VATAGGLPLKPVFGRLESPTPFANALGSPPMSSAGSNAG
jgi:hypothetical protein